MEASTPSPMNAQKSSSAALLVLLLATSLCAHGLVAWHQMARSVPSFSNEEQPHIASPPSPSAAPLVPKAFSWTEVESDDFSIYIANLRKIGCPEITIQRLVSAELDEVCAASEQENTQRSSTPKHGAGGYSSTSKTASRSGLLRKQDIMAALFPTVASMAASDSSVREGDGAPNPKRRTVGQPSASRSLMKMDDVAVSMKPISIPLALKESSSQILGKAEYQTVVDTIKDQFIANIGGPNQDPTDPSYIQRWHQAQALADEQLRKYLGGDAYNRLSALSLLEANSKAYPEAVK
jgi:hypothetical protein